MLSDSEWITFHFDLQFMTQHRHFMTKLFAPYIKLLQSSPCYLRDLITVQPSWSTQSSTLVTVLQPSVDSSLKITNHSFPYAAPHLWNKLPPTFMFLISLMHHYHPALLHHHALILDMSHGVSTFVLKPSFSQSLSLHCHLSLAQFDLLKFDHSVFGSHWRL